MLSLLYTIIPTCGSVNSNYVTLLVCHGRVWSYIISCSLCTLVYLSLYTIRTSFIFYAYCFTSTPRPHKGKPQGKSKFWKSVFLRFSVSYVLDSDKGRPAWVKRKEWGILEEDTHKQRQCIYTYMPISQSEMLAALLVSRVNPLSHILKG